MVIAEIVPAFKVFQTSWFRMPDLLSIARSSSCRTNAVLVGFLSSFAGFNRYVHVVSAEHDRDYSGVVPHFFVGAAAELFGNATGGRRGAILGAFNSKACYYLPASILIAGAG